MLATTKPTQAEPVSLRSFAESHGISYDQLRKYCQQGRVIGARQHVRTKHWWIYPPAQIVPSQKRW